MKTIDIKPFLSKDELRPHMCEVMRDGKGYAYASNAHIVIRWPEGGEETPECPKGVKEIFEFNGTAKAILSIDSYNQWKYSLDLAKEIDPCSECEGYKTVEFEYYDNEGKRHGIDEDCPICDGIGGSYTGEMIPNPAINYRIKDNVFSQANMDKVIKAMEQLDVKEVAIGLVGYKGYVSIYQYDIVIMGILA